MADLEFNFTINGQEYRVEKFTAKEDLSKPFNVFVSLISDDHDIDLDSLILQRSIGCLTLRGQGKKDKNKFSRIFNGIINEAQYILEGKMARYQMMLVPSFWFLTQRQNCRIFQDKSIPDIIKNVFSDAGIDNFSLDLDDKNTLNLFKKSENKYPTKDYVLQYRETDAQFLERLFSENGLFYYFEHSLNAHKMVIVNSVSKLPMLVNDEYNSTTRTPPKYHPSGGGIAAYEHINNITQIRRIRTDSVSYNTHNYDSKNPHIELQDSAPAPGLTRFDYPGRFEDETTGKNHVEQWLAEYNVQRKQISASSNIMRMMTGHKTQTLKADNTVINDATIISIQQSGNIQIESKNKQEGTLPSTYQNQFIYIPNDIEFKAPKMPTPIIYGPQTAIVVGPKGEAIHTDQLGRIKVKFHWDRAKANENTSCWIRVSQSMAGAGFGAVYIPRVGQEVIVSFLDGDPDRPLVTGAVYNPSHQLPYKGQFKIKNKNKTKAIPFLKTAIEEELNSTRTTFRTQTVGTKSSLDKESTDNRVGYNELSFEDLFDNEEIYIHAEKNMSTEVRNDRYQHIAQNEHLHVGGEQSNYIELDKNEHINRDKETYVEGNFTETVHGKVILSYRDEVKHIDGFIEKINENGRNVTMTKEKIKVTTITTKEGKEGEESKEEETQEEIETTGNDVLTVNDYTLTTEGSRTCIIKMDDNKTVEQNLNVKVTENIGIKGEKEILIEGESITLKAGDAILEMKDGNITISGKAIKINGKDAIALAAKDVKVG